MQEHVYSSAAHRRLSLGQTTGNEAVISFHDLSDGSKRHVRNRRTVPPLSHIHWPSHEKSQLLKPNKNLSSVHSYRTGKQLKASISSTARNTLPHADVKFDTDNAPQMWTTPIVLLFLVRQSAPQVTTSAGVSEINKLRFQGLRVSGPRSGSAISGARIGKSKASGGWEGISPQATSASSSKPTWPASNLYVCSVQTAAMNAHFVHRLDCNLSKQNMDCSTGSIEA